MLVALVYCFVAGMSVYIARLTALKWTKELVSRGYNLRNEIELWYDCNYKDHVYYIYKHLSTNTYNYKIEAVL